MRIRLMIAFGACLMFGISMNNSYAQNPGSETMIRAPQDCKNMDEIRTEIDRIDKGLVKLLGERVSYVARAVDIKAEQGLPAFIPARIEAVIAHVKKEAQAQGVDPTLAEKVWRDIVGWSVDFEHERLDKNK